LTHTNISEFLVTDGYIVNSGNSLDFRSGIDSREKHKEGRNFRVSLGKGFEDAERRLLDIFLSHDLSNERS